MTNPLELFEFPEYAIDEYAISSNVKSQDFTNPSAAIIKHAIEHNYFYGNSAHCAWCSTELSNYDNQETDNEFLGTDTCSECGRKNIVIGISPHHLRKSKAKDGLKRLYRRVDDKYISITSGTSYDAAWLWSAKQQDAANEYDNSAYYITLKSSKHWNKSLHSKALSKGYDFFTPIHLGDHKFKIGEESLAEVIKMYYLYKTLPLYIEIEGDLIEIK